ncbi:MAG: aminodeoxychorismate synthase component I, partial [Deltaproteobacteria bacterium]|nr:aminodeoxychorismate synthase component I [Deltaproteobacteria bacterium]
MKNNISEYLNNKITDVYIEPINIKEKFIDFAQRFADIYGACVLISGGKDNDCARYDILGIKPWFRFQSKGKKIEISINENRKKITGDPFDILKQIVSLFKTKNSFNLPITCGFIGYFSYDLKNLTENLDKTCLDTMRLPDILLFAHLILVVFDKKEQKSFLCIPKFQNCKTDYINKTKEEFYQDIEKPIIKKKYFADVKDNLASGFTKESYINSIRKIKEYIKAGDIYQANMTQRFETDFDGCAYTLFKKLYKKNPAPFFAYINGENHHIVSTSPERFILRKGSKIETRPIKGTRPRKKDKTEDKFMANELCKSKKDDAELSMIVDLLRNDIGKVCKSKTVKVTAHKKLETYNNVFHLVSHIKGTLDPANDSIDLIKAVFPGGSITGCPKIRAMEIIEELEPVTRHIYTGSIGYISFHDTLDLSIAIRTATIYDKKIYFSVGGGIVYDSDPEDEYNETLYKGETFFNILKKNSPSKTDTNFIWINGKIEPENQTFISVTDKGFLYGYGFFETIKAKKGKPLYLKEHIERFKKTWKSLFTKKIPDVNWLTIIRQTLEANLLTDKNAAVKIIASEKNLIVNAKEYTSRIA